MRPGGSPLCLWLAALAVYAFLYLPLAVVVIFSFNDSLLNAEWVGFTTRWYAILLADEEMLRAAGNSLFIAVVASLIPTVLGTMVGIAMQRWPVGLLRALPFLVLTPVAMPEILLGVSLLLFLRCRRRRHDLAAADLLDDQGGGDAGSEPRLDPPDGADAEPHRAGGETGAGQHAGATVKAWHRFCLVLLLVVAARDVVATDTLHLYIWNNYLSEEGVGAGGTLRCGCRFSLVRSRCARSSTVASRHRCTR